jgi:hypothetical protein
VALSDQPTAYALAPPEAQQLPLCVLMKTKQPRIDWHFAKRNSGHMAEHQARLQLVSGDIAAGKFLQAAGEALRPL